MKANLYVKKTFFMALCKESSFLKWIFTALVRDFFPVSFDLSISDKLPMHQKEFHPVLFHVR